MRAATTAISRQATCEAIALRCDSMDGHIALRDVAVGTLSATTQDGRIEAGGLNVSGNANAADRRRIGSSRASRRMPISRLTLRRATAKSRLTETASNRDDDSSTQRTIRLGAGNGQMKVRHRRRIDSHFYQRRTPIMEDNM